MALKRSYCMIKNKLDTTKKEIYIKCLKKWKEMNFDEIPYDKGLWDELMKQEDALFIKDGLKYDFLVSTTDEDDKYDDDTTIHFNNDELISQLEKLLTHKQYFKWRTWIKEAWNEDPIV